MLCGFFDSDKHSAKFGFQIRKGVLCFGEGRKITNIEVCFGTYFSWRSQDWRRYSFTYCATSISVWHKNLIFVNMFSTYGDGISTTGIFFGSFSAEETVDSESLLSDGFVFECIGKIVF